MSNGHHDHQLLATLAQDAPPSSSAMVSVPLAIIIGLIFSFIQSLGLTIQRKSHLISARQPLETRRPEWRQPLWLFGFLVFLIANVGGTVFQIGALPIVMLAPLGAVSLLYNALLAKFLLQDALGPMMIGGTALILIGAVLIGYFGAIQEAPHSLDELLGLFARGPFIALITILFMTFLCVSLIAHLGEWQLHASLLPPEKRKERSGKGSKKGHGKHSRLARRWSAPSLAPLDEVSETTSGVATPVLEVRDRERQLGFEVATTSNSLGGRVPPQQHRGSPPSPKKLQLQRNYGSIPTTATSPTKRQSRRASSAAAASKAASSSHARPDPEAVAKMRLLLAVAFAALSGTLSGLCLLLAKSGVELLVLTFGQGQNQFNRLGSWALVGVMIFAALAQLWYLNKALKMADPTLVCPLAFCFYNTSSIALGLVYFNQLADISAGSLCLIVLGIAVLLGGVFIVSMKPVVTEEGELAIEEAVGAAEEDEITGSPTTTMTETPSVLANAAGVAGPHLPPLPSVTVASPTSDEDLESQLPRAADEESALQTSPTPLSPSRKPQRRRGSHSRSSSIVAGLGLHLPEYNASVYQEDNGPLSPKSTTSTTSRHHRSRTEPSTTSRPSPPTLPGGATQHQHQHQHHRRASSSLYHSILNRGLSIGLSPSSPGFHIGPFSPSHDDDDDEEDDDVGSIRSLAHMQRLRGPRRVVSEADADGLVARLSAAGVASSDEEAAGGESQDSTETPPAPSSSSAFGLRLPTLDTAALSQRLNSVSQVEWLGGVKRWWARNVNGRQEWGEEERRRLLGG